MNHFIKNQHGNVMERVILLALLGLLIIQLFRLVGYIECVNNKSMDRISSAVSGLLYENEPKACSSQSTLDELDTAINEGSGGGSSTGGTGTGSNTGNIGENGTGNGTSSGGTGTGSESGGSGGNGSGGSSSSENISYYNYVDINPTCTPSTFNYPFTIPTDATENSTGTKTITITNQSGWDVWVKITGVSPKNNLTVDAYDTGYKAFKNGTSITFDIRWSWSSGARGAAAVSLQSTCTEPSEDELYMPIPGAPTNVKVSKITNDSLTFVWDDIPYATTYQLIFNPPVGIANGTSKTVNVTSPTYTHSDLYPGTTYNFIIKSVNARGTSSTTSSNGKTSGASPIPGVATNLVVTSRTDTTITVSWSSASKATQYSATATGSTVASGTTGSTSYTFTNLLPGTPYTIKILPQNEVGYAVSSTTLVNIYTTGTTNLPDIPGNVVITNATNTTMTLSWSAADRANSYIVYFISQKRTLYSGPKTSYTVTGLKPATTYQFSVQSVNAYGVSSTVTIVGNTTNLKYDDVDSPSATSCQAGSYTKEYALPSGIKPGNSGKFEIKIANTLKSDIRVVISASDKVGEYFEGSKPVTLLFDSSPLVVPPDATGSRSIVWSLPADAGNEYDGKSGSFSALVLLECSN